MKKVWVVHPFLMALFPVLFLYAQNLDQLSWPQAWPSIRFVGGSSLLLFLLLALILRNLQKAGLVTSLFVMLFFSYTRVVNLVVGAAQNLTGVNVHLIVFIAWGLIFAAGTALVFRLDRALEGVTQILNVTALVLVSVSMFNVSVHEFRSHASGQENNPVQPAAWQGGAVAQDELPDIYYLIVDGYARSDILTQVYDYDNSSFLTYLRDKGFYVAEQSRSNYAQTMLSLASSLNAEYLDDQAAAVGPGAADRKPLEDMVQDSAVVRVLKEAGYTTVAFPSSYEATDLRAVDVYMGHRRTLNALEIELFIDTPIPWLLYREIGSSPYDPHRQTILFPLEHLADAAAVPGPHFVFAHVVAPHPPFVFDRYGNEIVPKGDFSLMDGDAFLQTGTRQEYLAGYIDQLIFVNSKLEAMLDDLLARSSRPTIVILQADHGPGSLLHWDDAADTCFKERLSILNAYLLPGTGAAELYPEISPVNTFRLILNHYLGADLELLPDRSYFSLWDQPYAFMDVTGAMQSSEPACSP